MKQWLTIGGAAQHLGLSVDRVRRLANEGTLKARRTPGGHRRFHIAVLDSYRKRKGQKPAAGSRQRASPKPKRAPLPAVESFQALVDNPDELTEFDLNDPGDRIGLEPAEPTPIEPVAPMQNGPATYDRTAHDDDTRLQTIKNWGLAAIPPGTPAYWRARVLQDLERYVIAGEFPAGLPLNASIALVRGRVKEVLESYEKEKAVEAQRVEDEKREAAAERQKAEEPRRIQELVAYGHFHARLETLLWDREDSEDIREEIEEALQERVGSDWTKREVAEVVDDILDQYEDDED